MYMYSCIYVMLYRSTVAIAQNLMVENFGTQKHFGIINISDWLVCTTNQLG